MGLILPHNLDISKPAENRSFPYSYGGVTMNKMSHEELEKVISLHNDSPNTNKTQWHQEYIQIVRTFLASGISEIGYLVSAWASLQVLRMDNEFLSDHPDALKDIEVAEIEIDSALKSCGVGTEAISTLN